VFRSAVRDIEKNSEHEKSRFSFAFNELKRALNMLVTEEYDFSHVHTSKINASNADKYQILVNPKLIELKDISTEAGEDPVIYERMWRINEPLDWLREILAEMGGASFGGRISRITEHSGDYKNDKQYVANLIKMMDEKLNLEVLADLDRSLYKLLYAPFSADSNSMKPKTDAIPTKKNLNGAIPKKQHKLRSRQEKQF